MTEAGLGTKQTYSLTKLQHRRNDVPMFQSIKCPSNSTSGEQEKETILFVHPVTFSPPSSFLRPLRPAHHAFFSPASS